MNEPLPFVDLAAVHRELGAELEAAVLEVIRSAQFVGGPVVAAFEREFAGYLQCEHTVAMANGTDALELALRALELPAGAEVLVPANTFIATAAAVVRAGGVPRFVDVEPDTGLIDVGSCEEQLSERTWGLMPVHLYGRTVPMRPLLELAERHGLAIVEDAAQAHGAQRDGCYAGTFGHIGCFSFYPGKNLGAFGDAGAAVTHDPRVADRLRLLREHGRRDHRTHELVGANSRMDPVQAAVLRVKLRHLDRYNEQRRRAAAWYREALPPAILDGGCEVPEADVHHLFPILVEDRDALAARLAEAGVQTGVHYAPTVPQTGAFAWTGGCIPGGRTAGAASALAAHAPPPACGGRRARGGAGGRLPPGLRGLSAGSRAPEAQRVPPRP